MMAASNLQTNLCSQYQLTNLNADDAVIQSTLHLGHPMFTPQKDFNLPVADFVSYKMNMAEKCQHLCGKARHRRSNSGGAIRWQLQRPKNSFGGLLWASVFGAWEFFPFYFGFAGWKGTKHRECMFIFKYTHTHMYEYIYILDTNHI